MIILNDAVKNSDVLLVRGGQIPNGTVRVSGAKNSATRLMAASLLTDEKVHLDNFPTDLVDVNVKASFMSSLGVTLEFNKLDESLDIKTEKIIDEPLADYDYPIRTTYLLVAGQLLRNGVARIPYPGGCRIGVRKYDLHIMVWERMGCSVEEKDGFIEVKTAGLKASKIDFPISTVGGTENALLCSSVVDGTTEITNAYVTPEILDLIELLRLMGSKIELVGNSRINVMGSSCLRGASKRVMPDRIEALTWIVYAAISGGSIVVSDVPFDHMKVPVEHLREAGVDLFKNTKDAYVSPKCCPCNSIQPFEVACGTHPGVISDMQAFFVLLAMFANGRSRVFDYRYPDRTQYLEELNKMCPGHLSWKHGEIVVDGPVSLSGCEVNSTDLRGSMAVMIAGLMGKGDTKIRGVSMALRGYNRLLDKLNKLGVELSVLRS